MHKGARALIAALAANALMGCAGDASEPSNEVPPGVDLADPQLIRGTDFVSLPEAAVKASPNQPAAVPLSAEQEQEIFRQMANQSASLDGQGLSPKAGVDSEFSWQPGTAVNDGVLGSTFQLACFVTRVGGRLSGAGTPSFRVGSRDGATIYVWKDAAAFGGVRCIPLTSFTTSNGFVPQPRQYVYSFVWDSPSTWFNTGTRGDYASTISGVGYDMNSFVDYFKVAQSSAMNVQNQAFIQNLTSPQRGVGFVTDIQMHNTGVVAKFRGPNGTGTASSAGEWSYNTGGFLANDIDLGVPYSSNACYYTAIVGNFASGQDWVQLYKGATSTWHLSLKSNTSSGVGANVRCLPFAQ